jgi:hypothetical protein
VGFPVLMVERMENKKWVFVCWVGIFLFASAETWGADWKLLTTKASGVYYFDADSIQALDNKNIRVWGKEILAEKGKSQILKNLGEAFMSLYSASVLFEINCREKMIRALMVEYYSQDGFILSADSYEGEWEIVIPDTTQDLLRKKVCQ